MSAQHNCRYIWVPSITLMHEGVLALVKALNSDNAGQNIWEYPT